jgi:leucyl aminopeptidase
MDFGHRVAPPQGLGKLEVDALVLVVAAGAIDKGLGAPLADLLADAVAEGDLALKKGKTLYLHRPAGFAARRVVVAVAADAAAKSFKTAVAQGFSALKGGGAKSLAVAWGGSGTMSDAHAEAAVLALADATYLYRHTKPSAPAAWAADSALICQRRGQGVQAGLTGAAIAEGDPGARVRQPARQRVHADLLGQQAKKISKAFDLRVGLSTRNRS